MAIRSTDESTGGRGEGPGAASPTAAAATTAAAGSDPPAGEAIVQARDLRKVYRGSGGGWTRLLRRREDSTGKGPVEAVRDLSLSCHAGQVYGLLGPNGAGKTTTLRMLSTVLSPTAGTAVIAGHDVVREPHKVRQQIGFLSGNTGLYPRLSPREVLTYFAKLHGMERDAIEQRIDALAERLGMTEFLDKRCDALSSGMKQKVNVARTFVHDPQVLILDEPTVGLDVLASRTIVEFVRDCREQGKCVIFSTHIMGEVSRLCDRLAIIHKGRVQFEGTLDALRVQAGDDLEEAFVTVLDEAT